MDLFHTPDGVELQAVSRIVDEAFRDDHGNPTDHPGLRFRFSDSANKGPLRKILSAAEANNRRTESLSQDPVPSGVKKRKRPETPPEDSVSGDEARFIHQEERAAKRIAENDPDYKINK
ncbi:hypothetical protein DM02DRAFT_661338 [Periconia macrospinosa]|uniref:Uncharacterized protein n=1 Tax=Periconia macrospinosa TaxID=97972 RepID=A0A2V1D7Q0_9PLEO|nr:hypothetical protein DM02DRAFT_661338 [Periconia macrospinosa]